MKPATWIRVLSAAAGISSVVCASSVGCLGFEPRPVPTADTELAAGLEGDSGSDASRVDEQACLSCVKQGGASGCSSEFGACASTGSCEPFFVCGMLGGCYVPGTDLMTCLAPCASANGIASPSEPSVPPWVKLYTCVNQRCSRECTPG